MFVSIRASKIQIYVCVGHAPHSGHSEQYQRSWWREVTEAVKNRDVKVPLYALLDANGYVDVNDGVTFGAELSKKANLPGQLLRQFFDDFQLFAPATFPCFNGKSRNLHLWREVPSRSSTT